MLVPRIFHDSFSDDLLDDFFDLPARKAATSMSMNADVKEYDDRYELDIELPGYRKEDIQAELTDGYLVITASREEKNDEKDRQGKYIRRERFVGSLRRSFYVGDEIKQEDISAGFENGILKMSIPKLEERAKKDEKSYISIQ